MKGTWKKVKEKEAKNEMLGLQIEGGWAKPVANLKRAPSRLGKFDQRIAAQMSSIILRFLAGRNRCCWHCKFAIYMNSKPELKLLNLGGNRLTWNK